MGGSTYDVIYVVNQFFEELTILILQIFAKLEMQL